MPHGDILLGDIASKPALYAQVLELLGPLLEDDGFTHVNWITNLSNTSSLLFNCFLAYSAAYGHTEGGDAVVNWCGFYLKADMFPLGPGPAPDLLLLGPFNGRPACQQILPRAGKGVCADAYTSQRTLIVDDVDAYPGHIACDGETKSEIVLPLRTQDGRVIGVLDLDSIKPACFDDDDRAGLEKVIAMLARSCTWP